MYTRLQPDASTESAIPKTELAAKIQNEMNARDMTIDDLRDILQTTYETTRRFVKGMNTPSNTLLKIMSDAFKWDFNEVKSIAIRDRERVKHGDLLDVAHGLDPEPQRFVRAWPVLSKSQRRLLLEQLSTYVKANKVK